MKTGLNKFWTQCGIDKAFLSFGLRVLSSYFLALVMGLLESAHCDNCPTKNNDIFTTVAPSSVFFSRQPADVLAIDS